MKISNKLKSRNADQHGTKPKLSKDRPTAKPAPANGPGTVYFSGNPEA